MKFLIQVLAFFLPCCAILAQPQPKHDLHFSNLAKSWDEAIPLGNGMVGALIWQKEGRLRFSLDRADLWDERPMKGLHRKEFSYKWVAEQVRKKDYAIVQQYFDAPYDKEAAPAKIPGGALEFISKDWGTVESVHLSIKDAVSTVQWNSGVVMKTFVHATKPLGWFRFENVQKEFIPELVAPKYQRNPAIPFDSLKSNDIAKLGYEPGVVTKGKNIITYNQDGWNGFKYQISVSWKYVDTKTIEGAWSVTSNFSAKAAEPVAATLVTEAVKSDYKSYLSSHNTWWKSFWSKSSLQIPDSTLERQWYLDQYKFGSTARLGAPPVSLQAVWTADNGRLPPWKGDYHHDLNTELSYWPAYSANHLQESLGFIDHLEENKDTYKKYTKLYFGTDGIAVPGVTTLKGTEMGGWIQFALSPTVSAWLAQHYYLQWRYSMDRQFLAQKAYPWFKEVAHYFEEVTVKDEQGLRELPISSSPEIRNNSIDAWFQKTTNYDLALIKYVFKYAAELASELGLKEEAKKYQRIGSEFREFALTQNQELMYAPGLPYYESHRHFSNVMAFHPLGLIKWEDGKAEQSIIKNTINQLDSFGADNWNGYSYAWLANIKARAKDGEGAVKAQQIFAKAFTSINSFHVNGDQTKSGYSKRTYRPFTLEGNFAAAAGLQEMLLQSYAGFIEILPAIPGDWSDVSFKSFRAEGAFLVSAKKADGKLKEVEVVGEKGGTTRLKLPKGKWLTETAKGAKLKRISDEFVQLSFEKGGRIVLRNN